MNPDLERLVRLQQAESDLKRVEAELVELPKIEAGLQERLAAERGRLDAVRASLAQSLKARRQLEAELQDLEGKRSKYKGQLMEVKTNREYSAMLHEIEGVEREIRAREDQILAEMERAETLAAEIEREQAAFRQVEATHAAEQRALEQRGKGLAESVRRLTAERDAAAEAVPAELMNVFQRVARLRGAAVAEARDGICQLCRVKLRPQMYVDVKRNDSIIQCPSCSRVLFFEAAVAAELPQP